MGIFLVDSFTDVNGTVLSAHVGETGAAWTKYTGFAAGSAQIQGNKVNSAVAGQTFAFFSSGVPASPDYDVVALLNYHNTTVDFIGVALRLSQAGGYFGIYSTFDGHYYIGKLSGAILGSFPLALPTGAGYLRLSARGTLLTLSTSPDASTWTQRVQVTDATYSAAGNAGVYGNGAGVAGTDGIEMDSISASDPIAGSISAGGGLVAGAGASLGTFLYCGPPLVKI